MNITSFFLECCEKVKISGGFRFSTAFNPFEQAFNQWSKCLRFYSLGDGTYTRDGLDVNGRPIYRNDRYKNDPMNSKGEGSMILSFDNIKQEWFVSYRKFVMI